MAHHPAWVGHHTGGSRSKTTVHPCPLRWWGCGLLTGTPSHNNEPKKTQHNNNIGKREIVFTFLWWRQHCWEHWFTRCSIKAKLPCLRCPVRFRPHLILSVCVAFSPSGIHIWQARATLLCWVLKTPLTVFVARMKSEYSFVVRCIFSSCGLCSGAFTQWFCHGVRCIRDTPGHTLTWWPPDAYMDVPLHWGILFGTDARHKVRTSKI